VRGHEDFFEIVNRTEMIGENIVDVVASRESARPGRRQHTFLSGTSQTARGVNLINPASGQSHAKCLNKYESVLPAGRTRLAIVQCTHQYYRFPAGQAGRARTH
jgi:hypothetical protein